MRNALNEADFDAAAMVEETVAAWKDPAPPKAQTMTRSKLRNFTKKKKAWAENEMGRRYFLGEGGLHQSYEEAVKWYEKAARQGHARAQCGLGLMYDNGKGVPQSYQKAMEYYELSARQGDAFAEYNLGCMFYNGHAVEKDVNKARELLTRSAEHDNEDAIKVLQILDEEEREEMKKEEKKEEEMKKEKQKTMKKNESLSEQVVPTVQTVSMVAVWKDPAPANAETMTRSKLRNFTKKKESVG